ncbi:toxin-antitoxin system YwqK family antitoxin [Saccharicrinis sp. GN24d3]|uniref:toxin-antitoxin system YwqK family antitoxin n=1 Tax=Saccharicrinis sp. GN24d3 TaxID=3458416 RepID=UPI004035BA8E
MRILFYLMVLVLIFAQCSNTKTNENVEVYLDENNDTLHVATYNSSGLLHGKYRTFSNNKVDSVYHYINGKKHGKYFVYFNNGNISEKGCYIDGRLIGKVEVYKNDGSLLQIIVYGPGENPKMSRINQIITYDDNGNIDMKDSNFCLIGLLEELNHDDQFVKLRIQYYPQIVDDTKMYVDLKISSNDSIGHNMRLYGNYKKDFIIPTKSRLDSLKLKGYVYNTVTKAGTDTVYGESFIIFNIGIKKMKIFNDILPKNLSFLPIKYDTLSIDDWMTVGSDM